MTEIWSNIPISARYFLISWIFLVVISFILFIKKHKFFLWALGMSAFSLATAFAVFTPYLFRWDEQFHALVGKNLASNPFHPILIDIDPSLWNTKDWANTYTWLHKQPLFLYQIALSIKVFGAKVYAVRLPSIILHVIGTLSIFDIGRMMYNRNLGFLAAMLFSVSAFPLGLLSGRIGTDHNDSVFMIYVLLSFWAWFKFYTSGEKKWVIWIGVFVGCAILTKWLVGLLIFAPWGLLLVLRIVQKQKIDFKSFYKSLVIALFIAVPWQIYIFIRFPKVASHEMNYNSRHFFEAIEGHAGDWKFHFLNVDNLFFNSVIVSILFVFSIYGYFSLKRRQKMVWLFMAFSIVIVYLFFSFAATKMGSFVGPVFPMMILLMTFPVAILLDKFKTLAFKNTIILVVFIVGFFLLLKPANTAEEYAFGKDEEKNGVDYLMRSQWHFFDKHPYADDKQLVINGNLRDYGSVSWQFKNNTKVLSNIPSKSEIEKLKNAGYKISCVKWKWGTTIPDYILSDTAINYIQFE